MTLSKMILSMGQLIYSNTSCCLLAKGFVKVKSEAEIRNDVENADGMDRCH